MNYRYNIEESQYDHIAQRQKSMKQKHIKTNTKKYRKFIKRYRGQTNIKSYTNCAEYRIKDKQVKRNIGVDVTNY